MLPLHGRAISGVTSELQDRSNYNATVQEVRAGGGVRVSPVRRTSAYNSASDVKRDDIDPDGKDGGSGNNGAISYAAVANEVQEEERLRQERSEQELGSQTEEMRYNPPLGMDFTSPSVIVPRGEPHHAVAKLFIKAAQRERSAFGRDPSVVNASPVKVDVTI